MLLLFFSLILITLYQTILCEIYFKETFTDDYTDRWVVSDWKKKEGLVGEFALNSGEFHHNKKEDQGLKTTQDAKFYTIAAKFDSFSNEGKDLVIQFQVKNEQRIECGGGYLKIGPAIDDLKNFTGETEYNIMFGPDQCGSTKRTHLIFRYNGTNHLRKQDLKTERDNLSHVYTLVVKPDNTYVVYIDLVEIASGKLEEDWDMLPPKSIKDPKAEKPSDWVDEEMIPDPDDKKPDDWVEEKEIADPDATKPEDWDDEEDGVWTAPMIANPKYQGEWAPKKIPNPDYKGEWEHPMIDNEDYKPDPNLYMYKDFSMVGIDVWQVKSGTIFDNILIGDDFNEAKEFAEKTFVPLQKAEKKQKEAKDAEEKKKREEAEAAAKANEKEEEEGKDLEDDDDKDDVVHDEL